MTRQFVVYTVVTNPRFNPSPPDPAVEAEHICFYAGDRPEAPGWRAVEFFPPDEICEGRASRIPKALPHRFLEEFEFSVYADTSVHVTGAVNGFFSSHMKSKDIGLIRLPHQLEQEFIRVEKRRYDDIYTLRLQESEYRSSGLHPQTFSTYWGGLILRRHNEPSVKNFGERWMANILRFSRRDQLSLPVALQELQTDRVILISGNDEKSQLHRRLQGIAKEKQYVAGAGLILKPPASDIREGWLVEEIGSLRQQIRQLSTARRLSWHGLNRALFSLRPRKPY